MHNNSLLYIKVMFSDYIIQDLLLQEFTVKVCLKIFSHKRNSYIHGELFISEI